MRGKEENSGRKKGRPGTGHNELEETNSGGKFKQLPHQLGEDIPRGSPRI